jgi:peroxiredoxin
MEKNREAAVEAWVGDQLAGLDSREDWQPNVAQGLARFRERCQMETAVTRWQVWVATAAVVACIGVLALRGSVHLVSWLSRSSDVKMVNVGQVWAASSTLRVGETAPDFALKDAAGANIRLSAYKGNVVLLNFWATWCEGCKIEIPWLVQFERKYGSKGLTVVGASMDDGGWKAVKPFIAEHGLNYSIVIGNEALARSYGLSAMPMTILIDRKGRIAAMSVGTIDRAACEAEIIRLL